MSDSSVVMDLAGRGLVVVPPVANGCIHYEVLCGSVAYGLDGSSQDWDVVGFCVPAKEVVFPHLAGDIIGFGRQKQYFAQWQKHHVLRDDIQRSYDLTIYNIVKFFSLCMENNPNMVDALFVPERCVLFASEVGRLVRENRKLFLHKGSFHKFKGYAYSQLSKMRTKNPEGKRAVIVERYGYDTKYAYHLLRLLLEAEQILVEGDLDLERHREQLKAIRNGLWTMDRVEDFFREKEAALERVYHESQAVPYKPDEAKIKELLLQCLAIAYGSRVWVAAHSAARSATQTDAVAPKPDAIGTNC